MKIEMSLTSQAWGSRFALSLAVVALAGQITLHAQTVGHFAGGRTNLSGTDFGSANGSTNFSGAQFNGPGGLAFDVSGRYLYVADVTNRAVRRLDTISKQVSTPIQFTAGVFPMDVATDRSTNVYVLTTGDGLIRTYNRSHALVATNNLVALTSPTAMAFDANGNFYVTESGGAVKVVATNGIVTTVATITGLVSPQGIEVMDNGLVAISDTGNHVIRLYNPANSNYVVFAGQLGTNGTNNGATTNAQFSSPYQISKAGDNILIVADYGNHQVRKVDASGNVSLFYGHLPWFTLVDLGLRDEDFGIWPGNAVGAGGDDGPAEAREPRGVLVDGSGNVYVAENYYHVIRKVTDTGLSGPAGTSTGGGTQLPPVAPPTIGIAVLNEVTGQYNFTPITTSSALSPSTFYTNAIVVITSSETGVQTLYTVGGATDNVFNAVAPTPSATVGQPAPFYQTNQFAQPISAIAGQIQPFLTVRAISVQTGRTNSAVVEAVFNFKTPPPVIVISNNNAASFTLTDSAANAVIYYSTDGSDPTNGGPFQFNSASPTLSFNLETTNMLFKARAFVPNYEGSVVVSNLFTTNSFSANKISFGFESGEASSDFVAAPGSKFMAPVTLSLIPGQPIYGLQFTMQATNDSGSPPISLGAGSLSFESLLLRKNKNGSFSQIPPAQFLYIVTTTQVVAGVTSVVSGGVYTNTALLDTNQGFNILGVGWWERALVTIDPADDFLRLYNPLVQTLVTFSQAHDTTFPNAQNPGGVIVGGFRIQIPSNALPGQTYTIRIERPSASPDGINEDVFIQAPVSAGLPNTGSLKAMRTITVGSRAYTVGDVTPFRWFNAGDFGDTPTNRIKVNDVIHVFQTVVYSKNCPPPGSDNFDAFDSANSGLPGLLTSNVTKATIDAMKYGDGTNDLNDIFVTYQRALFSDLNWYQRYWTNIGGVSTQVVVTVPNIGPTGDRPAARLAAVPASVSIQSQESPHVRFTAEDVQAASGQRIQIPLRARIKGGLPIKIMMENITLEPLDGAPPIDQTVALTPAAGLGTPYGGTISEGSGNVAAVFLDNTVAGVSGTNLIGTLEVTLPTNIPPGAAYGVRFDRISASPNGLGIFPQTVEHGLITFGSRTNSSWNDGIPDSWRLRHFGTVSNYLSSANADADGDGVPNWAEHRAGTSPVDSASNLRLLSAQALTGGAVPPTGVTLTVPTVDGKTYILEYCSSLFGTNWTSLSNFTGTGVNVQLQDNGNATGEPRFYRIRLQE
ncbi:MAG: chitobiase/beta-hexosaminidase C-terminal domain-containing protein [Verrucomicrobia bacterium]|nr:chitobiase/beta-hexosaminidase C-terminal domain-containing protein [Verrucomicrobiota bacterium]